MADTAGAVALVSTKAPFGGHPGSFVFTLTYSSTTYVDSGNLNLSSIAQAIPGHTPATIKSINFQIGGSTAAYMILFTPATSPTWANLGVLRLFTATGAAATGSLTLVITGTAIVHGAAAF